MASTFSLTGRSPWGGGRDSPASITCWGKTISHRSISIHLSNHPSIHQSIHPSIRAASFDLGVQFKVPRLFSVEPRDPSIPLLAQATISFSMVMIPQDQDLWIGYEHYPWKSDAGSSSFWATGVCVSEQSCQEYRWMVSSLFHLKPIFFQARFDFSWKVFHAGTPGCGLV